jgi:hypothetical protein
MANNRGTLISDIPAGTNSNLNFEINIAQYGNHAASPKMEFHMPSHCVCIRERESDAIQYCPTANHSKQTDETGLVESTDMKVTC